MEKVQKTYLLNIYYNGYEFNGFQSQTDENSIQDKIEKGLSIYLGESIRIRGASRTDGGVHSFGQKVFSLQSLFLMKRNFL